jgi:hypothetical protein
MTVIEADREETWPGELLRMLHKSAATIADYHRERDRLDRAAEDDVMLRIRRPANPHKAGWDSASYNAGKTLSGAHLAGFHATRLIDAEVDAIRAGGLHLLSNSLFETRITGAQSAGLLAKDVANMLRARNQVHDDNRNGMTWFCFSRSMLHDESGMVRLFRCWGGEALYNSHENDALTGPALAAIGYPCIIRAAVPIDGIESFMGIGERLLNVWCANRGLCTGHKPEFEGYVRTDIPASGILNVIRFSDPEFVALTRHREWREPLS